jgi:hypothetical protein
MVFLPHLNYLAVLVGGVIIFILGGLWYSPMLFAKQWTALQGKTEAEMKAASSGSNMPLKFVMAFISGLLVSFTLAVVMRHFTDIDLMRGAWVGVICWVGFAGATSFANSLFSMKPLKLWLIDSGYNLVCFIVVGALLGAWR